MQTTQTTLNDGAIDALDKALVRSLDAKAGFRTMVEKSEPEFKSVATEFLTLHTAHADRLSVLLENHGQEPDTDGSFMAKINEGVVTLRALVDEIDEDVMDNVRNGEKHVISALDDAINAVPDAVPEHAALVEMKTDLDALLRRTQHLD
ncbi:MAG: DUF2383 domain-containing protein [Pseudomonadota bacterium]